MFSHISSAAHTHLSLEIGRRTRSLMRFPAPSAGEQGGKIQEESGVILPSCNLPTLYSAVDISYSEHLLQWWDLKNLGSLREDTFLKYTSSSKNCSLNSLHYLLPSPLLCLPMRKYTRGNKPVLGVASSWFSEGGCGEAVT